MRMRIRYGMAAVGIMCLTAVASAEPNALYEEQLSKYSRFHDEYLVERQQELERRQVENQRLRTRYEELENEYAALQADAGAKEASIQQLKKLNTDLQQAYKETMDQCARLEADLARQEEENAQLKQRLFEGHATFRQKMLDFFQQEDEVLRERIVEDSSRREAVKVIINEIEEELRSLEGAEEDTDGAGDL